MLEAFAIYLVIGVIVFLAMILLVEEEKQAIYSQPPFMMLALNIAGVLAWPTIVYFYLVRNRNSL